MANKRFKRQEYARYKKLGIKWRRPRGKTSKMRRYEAGKPDMPAIGYRTPRAIRDLHPFRVQRCSCSQFTRIRRLRPSN